MKVEDLNKHVPDWNEKMIYKSLVYIRDNPGEKLTEYFIDKEVLPAKANKTFDFLNSRWIELVPSTNYHRITQAGNEWIISKENYVSSKVNEGTAKRYEWVITFSSGVQAFVAVLILLVSIQQCRQSKEQNRLMQQQNCIQHQQLKKCK